MNDMQQPAAPEAVKTDSTALVAVQTALTEFDKIDAGLTELESKYSSVVYDCKTADGMNAALVARREIRDPRYKVEAIRKGAKAPVIALGKNIDQRAAYITDRLTKIENPIDAQIKAEEARREEARLAKERAEQQRQANINEAIDFIAQLPADAVDKNAAGIASAIAHAEAVSVGDEFAEHKARAQTVKDAALGRLRQMHTAALAREAEAARIAEGRAELERQKAVALERERKEAEERRQREAREQVERDRIAADEKARRDKIEADERAARERIEAAERQARAEREETDRKAKAARDAEDARLKAERDALERQQREARLADEKRQREAREAKEAAERAARAKADAVEAAKREKARKEQEVKEAKEREARRKAAQIADGRAHLQAFVDTFGEVHEFVIVGQTIREWLAESVRKAA